ncbi:hypothetical protein COL72_08405 [Bacillus toyonensis]|uniref:hypothetical protein n=1 Tax=Bacillus toyonensis TaxID=155322 RepID=UPI000BF3355A|nr:hypothetical protein [Bacillus toyonensis]PFZ73684.1 hypothetical protein COL72_08405 [Bacillus toyonensis]
MNDVGETFKTFNWKTEELASIEFPNGAPIGKAGSLQTKVPLQHLNMDAIDNQTIYFAHDIWIDGDYSKIKATLEVRFFDKSGNFDGIHAHEISPSNKRRRFTSLSTIFKRLDFDYAMIYFKYEFIENINPVFKILLGRPVISFGIPVGDFNHTDGGTTYGSDSLRALIYAAVSLGIAWNRKTWVNYKLGDNFENAYLKSSDSATFEAKWSGFYNVGLNAHFQVSGGGDPAAFCRVVFDIGKTGFSLNGSERVSQYYKTPDDKFSLNVNKTIYLNKGDKIYIRGFFDDNIGELKELRETATLYVTFIK